MLKPAAAAAERVAEVVDLAHDGRGVARPDGPGGKVVFIDGALPGERVRFRVRRHRGNVDEGELLAVEQASPDRVTPRCAHFGLCGGCSLQHLAPAAQAQFKQKQLLDALARIGGLVPEIVAAPVTGPAWGYRRRARLSVKHVPRKGGVLVGFREKDSPYVAQIGSCATLDARVGERLEVLAAVVERLEAKTLVPQIEVAAIEDRVALVFRVMQPPTAGDLAELRAFGEREGFEIYLQPAGLDSIRP
ncbi:MAG TPA: TRAM domain-containing protein, partial [Candidatus Binatia bacterium]|nr:TRAM domain-containing protein [Candidatus Binatia bacterium]